MDVVQLRSLLLPALLGTLMVACENPDPLAPSFGVSKAGAIAAPSNLSLTVDSYHQISFAWQDNATNESGYEVWKSTTGPSGAFSLFTTYPWPNTTAGGNDLLEPSTQYCYKVRAYNTLGQSGKTRAYSEFSNTACATTLSRIPAAPSDAHAAPDIWGRIQVNWTDNAGEETGFRIERATTSTGPWTEIGNTGANVTSFFDTQPPASEQTACYHIVAFNSYGSSPASNAFCTAIPSAPTALVAIASGSAVDLSWTDNSNVEDGFVVERWTAATSSAVIATLPANTSMYHDDGLADATYSYLVRAVKDGGKSASTNEANVLVATAPPPAPSRVVAYPTSSTAMYIWWTDTATTETGFRVERSTDAGASWSVVGTTAADERAIGDGGLASEQQDCYRVIAFNTIGDSPASSSVCSIPPLAPTGLTVTPGETGSLNLMWTDNSAFEDGYWVLRWDLVQYWNCPEGDECYPYYDYGWVEVATLGPDVTSYHDSGLLSGESHTYVVVALKDGGQSDQSNEATAVVP